MMKKALAILLALSMVFGMAACAKEESVNTDGDNVIVLADDGITFNGEAAGEKKAAVYVSSDIIYYEDKDTYESGNPYGEGGKEDKHSADEANGHMVVNITKAGTYRLQGTLSKGQIRVDLGEDANKVPEAVVTLILDNVDINCDVAPAILFLNVYECDNAWDPEEASADVDTSSAGANIVIADGSSNLVEGAYVAKIFKDKKGEKKLWKQDGAVYSYMSMNVNGESAGTGVLDITADNEGLDTELHLTINGGNINIRSKNDGINTNADGVSVTTINGGNVHIIAGLGVEGDGVDSNGWLVINGGTVISSASPISDAGLDSDMGSFVNGGTVVALGSTMDWAESDSNQVTMNLQFAGYKESQDAIVVKEKESGKIVFAYDPSADEVLGENTRQYMGAIVSCGAFALEDTYEVYIGGTLTGNEVGGVYDIDSITDYTDGMQQGYTGTDVRRFPGGGFDGGFGGGNPMERPEGMEFPQGGRPQKGDWQEMPETGEMQFDFYMQDKVNNFSGVDELK